MTKKMLVAYDPQRPSARSSDFLVPVPADDGDLALFGLASSRVARQGMVVFTGKRLSTNDLFARLVETGRKIENVDDALARLAAYLEMIKGLKVGNIVELRPLGEPRGFMLNRLAESPPTASRPLPG